MAAVGILSHYLNGSFPYARRHIPVNLKCVECVVNENISFLPSTADHSNAYTIGPRGLSRPDGAVAMLSAIGLVGSVFTSRYRLQPRAGF